MVWRSIKLSYRRITSIQTIILNGCQIIIGVDLIIGIEMFNGQSWIGLMNTEITCKSSSTSFFQSSCNFSAVFINLTNACLWKKMTKVAGLMC